MILHQSDWTRAHGITIDRSTLPPDDEITEAIAWVTGRFDSAVAGSQHEEVCHGHLS